MKPLFVLLRYKRTYLLQPFIFHLDPLFVLGSEFIDVRPCCLTYLHLLLVSPNLFWRLSDIIRVITTGYSPMTAGLLKGSTKCGLYLRLIGHLKRCYLFSLVQKQELCIFLFFWLLPALTKVHPPPMNGPGVVHAEKNAGNWSTKLVCTLVNCSGQPSLI